MQVLPLDLSGSLFDLQFTIIQSDMGESFSAPLCPKLLKTTFALDWMVKCVMHSEYDCVCQKWVDVTEVLPQTDHVIKGIYRQCWSIRLRSRLGTGVCKFLTVTYSELWDTCEGRCREMHLFPHSWLARCKCHFSSAMPRLCTSADVFKGLWRPPGGCHSNAL